jgi:hypothetical protein
MRFAFIDGCKEVWPVKLLCRIRQVTSRGFRAWRIRPMRQRQRDDMVLLAHIHEQHRLSLQSHSRPRITALGRKIGHRSIARLMRENDIKIVRTQKYKPGLTATTRSTSCPTCWIKISLQTDQTKSGLATYPISGPVKAGCTWPSSFLCSRRVIGWTPVGHAAQTLPGRGQQPNEARSRDPGLGHGGHPATTAERLQSSHRSWVAVLFKRVPKAPEQAQLQGLDERQGQLLRQCHGGDVFQIHQG